MKPLKFLAIQPYSRSEVSSSMLPSLMEIPALEELKSSTCGGTAYWSCLKLWMKDQVEKNLVAKRSWQQVQLLLGLLGSPLAPVPIPRGSSIRPQICVKDSPISVSSAQYIVHQYIAATTGSKDGGDNGWVQNFYAMGKVQMAALKTEAQNSTHSGPLVGTLKRSTSKRAVTEAGCFVLWQKAPQVWCVEMSLGGCKKVRAGSDGKLVWRHTPWLGSHVVKGPVRPLRRALQGMDPWTVGAMFAQAHCVGEKAINGEPCFILKLAADLPMLEARSKDSSMKVTRHVVLGFFSQKTGLLVELHDSRLLFLQVGSDAFQWESCTETRLHDYRDVDGVLIPHAGSSVLTLLWFGDGAGPSQRCTKLEENWLIEEVAFNVPGVSSETFMPPADLLHDGLTVAEDCELTLEHLIKSPCQQQHHHHHHPNVNCSSKVAALDSLVANGDM